MIVAIITTLDITITTMKVLLIMFLSGLPSPEP
jgi:hypothetical protein